MNSARPEGPARGRDRGASGLGFAIAERLTTSGATVMIWDLDEKASLAAAAALSGHCGITDVSDLAAVMRATDKRSSSFPPSTS